MLNQKQKNAIENLLILAQYVKDGSIYSDLDEKIINKSIKTAEILIGKRTQKENKNEAAELVAKEIKKRFNS